MKQFWDFVNYWADLVFRSDARRLNSLFGLALLVLARTVFGIMGHSLMFLAIVDAQIWAALIGLFAAAAGFVTGKAIEIWSINKAIWAELRRVIEALAREKCRWEELVKVGDTKDSALIPFRTDVYDSQLKNIGALVRKTAAIVRFFGYVKFINAFQDTRTFYIDKNMPQLFDRIYLEVLDRVPKDYARPFS